MKWIKDNYFVSSGVTEIGEGFNFVQVPTLVSCSLNGHMLETDPATPRNVPFYDSELVWETDKRALRRLRLQNVPLKVNVERAGGPRVGYLLLSLLTARPLTGLASHTSGGHSWHRLLGLGPEARGAEPRLLLCLTLHDSIPSEEESPTPRCPSLISEGAVPLSSPTVKRPESVMSETEPAPTTVCSQEPSSGDPESSSHPGRVEPEDSERRGNPGRVEPAELSPLPAGQHTTPQGSPERSRRAAGSEREKVEKEQRGEGPPSARSPAHQSRGQHQRSARPESGAISPGGRRGMEGSEAGSEAGSETEAQVQTGAERGRLSPETREQLTVSTVHALEEWKERQQELFTLQVERRCAELLGQLDAEWRDRALREREHCQALLQSLQVAVLQTTSTAEGLQVQQAELRLARDELEMHYTAKYHELNEAARRLEEDFNHRSRLQELQHSHTRAQLRLQQEANLALSETVRRDQEELDCLKKSAVSKEDMLTFLQEKKNLEEKLQAVTRSKQFFKEQWAAAVRDAQILRAKSSHTPTPL